MGILLKKLFKKRKRLKLEFCQNNLDRFLNEKSLPLFNEFLSKDHISIKEYNCLSQCQLCKEQPYAIANGEMIGAEHTQGLLNRLREMDSKQTEK